MRSGGGSIGEVSIIQGGNTAIVGGVDSDGGTTAGALSVRSFPNVFGPDGAWDRIRSIGDAAPWLGVQAVKDLVNITLEEDETANDQDKTFTVPSGYRWHILYIGVELSTTSTVGNRQIGITARNAAGDTIINIPVGAVQAASTFATYNYMPAVARETTVILASLVVPIPSDFWLAASFSIRVLETVGVSATDDMQVHMIVDKVEV